MLRWATGLRRGALRFEGCEQTNRSRGAEQRCRQSGCRGPWLTAAGRGRLGAEAQAWTDPRGSRGFWKTAVSLTEAGTELRPRLLCRSRRSRRPLPPEETEAGGGDRRPSVASGEPAGEGDRGRPLGSFSFSLSKPAARPQPPGRESEGSRTLISSTAIPNPESHSLFYFSNSICRRVVQYVEISRRD